jgi:hypothetical protein
VAQSMLYLISYHLLDLRLVITRPFMEDPRNAWLRPQWLWPNSEVRKVGRLGVGTPIPGRDRLVPAFSQHATVGGGLLLQTRNENVRKQVIDKVEQDGFVIHNREIVADEWGQVRFDLLIEDTDHNDCPMRDRVELLLSQRLVAPLDQDSEVSLAEAAEVIARVYERESLKTSEGFLDKARREEAVAAAAGTVSVAAETPQVILIDLMGEAPDIRDRVTICDAPCHGNLALFQFEDFPSDNLCWHLLVTTSEPSSHTRLEQAAWSAAFGLSWLVGHLHELSVFQSRVVEYERSRASILPDLVRMSIKRRNNRFGARRFGGWMPREVLAAATRMLWIERGNEQQRLQGIRQLVSNPRDASGITGNIVNVINDAREIKMNNTTTNIHGNVTGNVNIGSTLTNVVQSIGELPNVDPGTKQELTRLVQQLQAELKKLAEAKPDRSEQLEAVAVSTEEVVNKAKQEKPNKTLLQQAIDGAKAIAGTVKDIAPAIPTIVSAIGGIIATLHGL